MRDLCLNLIKSFVLSSGDTGLDIIFAAQRKPTPLRLPSWCPDYLHVRSLEFSNRILSHLARRKDRYRIGRKGEKWDTTQMCSSVIVGDNSEGQQPICFNRNSLFVHGVFVSRITIANMPDRGQKLSNAAGYFPHQPQVSDLAIFDQLSRLSMLYHSNYDRWSRWPETLKCLFGDTTWWLLNFSCP